MNDVSEVTEWAALAIDHGDRDTFEEMIMEVGNAGLWIPVIACWASLASVRASGAVAWAGLDTPDSDVDWGSDLTALIDAAARDEAEVTAKACDVVAGVDDITGLLWALAAAMRPVLATVGDMSVWSAMTDLHATWVVLSEQRRLVAPAAAVVSAVATGHRAAADEYLERAVGSAPLAFHGLTQLWLMVVAKIQPPGHYVGVQVDHDGMPAAVVRLDDEPASDGHRSAALIAEFTEAAQRADRAALHRVNETLSAMTVDERFVLLRTLAWTVGHRVAQQIRRR